MFENIKKRERIFEIWRKIKELKNLEGRDKYIAKALREHEEYNQFFDTNDVYEALNLDKGQDPCFHVLIHSILEEQMEKKDPIEAVNAYESLKKKGASSHEAMHAILFILADELYDAMKNKKNFNNEKYKERISRL